MMKKTENELAFSEEDEDFDIDSKQSHSRMVEKLTDGLNVEKQYKWQSKRKEVGGDFSQFAIRKISRPDLKFPKLTKLSKDHEAKRSLKSFHLKKVIARPLKKQIAERAARKVNFKQVSEEISKYDPVVKEVRHADQLVFEKERIPLLPSAQLEVKPAEVKKGTLEAEIVELISESQGDIESDTKVLTEKELELLKSRSLDEARALHKQIQKRRLLISFQEAKFRRMRKIKSKKYHRLLKKDKLKKTVDEFEKLVSEQSDKAMEKLEELDKLRALERASLKHMNTGKWAKHSKIRAKYDDRARESLNEQLKINEQMRKKRSLNLLETEVESKANDDKDEVQSNLATLKEILKQPNLSPWFTSNVKSKQLKMLNDPPAKPKDEVEETRKFLKERVQQRIKEYKAAEVEKILREDAEDELPLVEGHCGEEQFESEKLYPAIEVKKVERQPQDEEEEEDEFDPDLLETMKIAKNPPRNQLNALANDDDDDEIDDINFHNDSAQKYLHDIFDGDDVVEEFLRNKKESEKSSTEKDSGAHSAYVPGWGDWAGAGIKLSRKKRTKLIRKIDKKNKRITAKICNAIILNEEPEVVASKYKIAHRPAQINNVQLFEQRCLKPIGPNWNPESVSKTMTEPKIVTKLGNIIKPMSALNSAMKDQII